MPHHRESIFTTILKKFTGSFFSVIGFFLAIFLFFAVIGFAYKGSAGLATEILPMKVQNGSTGYTQVLNTSASTILQINIEGPIGMDKCAPMNTLSAIKKILRQPTFYNIKMDNIKGIFLRINSPGGSAPESDEIYEEIMAFKKKHNLPVHVWIGDMCFSGGYYLAVTGDYISAQTVSMIGSVGVRFANPNFNFYGLMEKLGITATIVSAGKNKIHFPQYTQKQPGTDSYKDVLNIAESIYDKFLSVVVEARAKHGLTEERLRELGATIYVGKEAKRLGYIDAPNVRYENAVEHFAETLGIKEKGYQVISFENPMSYLQNFQAKVESKFSALFGDESALPFSLEADYRPAL